MSRNIEAKTADGIAIRGKLWGEERPERRIALLHSLAMNADFWADVAERLAADSVAALLAKLL